MVEGPGCTLNGEKIRARVRPGQAVTDVRGSALQNAGGPGLPLSASETVVPSQVSLSCIFLGASRGKRNNPIKFSGVQGVLSLLWSWAPAFPKVYFDFTCGRRPSSWACAVESCWTAGLRWPRRCQVESDGRCFVSYYLFNFFTTQQKSIATFCAVNIIRSLQFLTCFFSFLILFKTISF